MSYHTKNSYAKAFNNWSRNKTLKPKKPEGVGGGGGGAK